MEYVLVEFPTDRLVYVDGEKTGYTNETLRVDAGTHEFTLGPYANYTPGAHKVMVRNTSVLAPLVLAFARSDE